MLVQIVARAHAPHLRSTAIERRRAGSSRREAARSPHIQILGCIRAAEDDRRFDGDANDVGDNDGDDDKI